MLPVGIDISKATFDCAARHNTSYQNKQFNNNQKGFKVFHTWLNRLNKDKQELVLCMEATGIYGVLLAKYLHQQGLKSIVANPIKTHAFATMEMSRSKTDKADAQSIARYCQHLIVKGELNTNLYTPKPQAFEDLQYLVARLEQLNKQRIQESNRLEASQIKVVSKSIKAMIKRLIQEITAIESHINHLIASDKILKRQVDLLVSIKGIGNKTAWSVLAYLGDVALFDKASQVCSFAGLNPKITQSGSSINKSCLSKMGHKKLRKALYMPAVVAKKHNPLIKALYERLLAKGKPKKLAICAVMRKLLVIAFGVLKSGKVFDVNYAK